MVNHTFSNKVRGTKRPADFKISIQCQGLHCSLASLSFPALKTATATRASSTHMMRNIVPQSHVDIQYVFILAGSWNIYVAYCGDVNASALIHRREVWSWALYIMGNECSAEHTVAVSTKVPESAEHRIWCTSSFLPWPRTFPKGNKNTQDQRISSLILTLNQSTLRGTSGDQKEYRCIPSGVPWHVFAAMYNKQLLKATKQEEQATKSFALLKIQIKLTRLWSISTYGKWDAKIKLALKN